MFGVDIVTVSTFFPKGVPSGVDIVSVGAFFPEGVPWGVVVAKDRA